MNTPFQILRKTSKYVRTAFTPRYRLNQSFNLKKLQVSEQIHSGVKMLIFLLKKNIHSVSYS